MKMRKAWYVVWSDGTKWLVDCAREIEEHRREGFHTIVPIRVLGTSKAYCSSCNLNLHR